jgi:hypothetical protein
VLQDLRLDPVTGDLDVATGGLVLTQGPDATRQRLEGRLSLQLAEWFLDERIGFPYQRDVFKRHTTRSLSLLESTYRRCIATCPGVKSLRSFSMRQEANRVLRISFVAINDENEPIEVRDFEPGGP